MICGVFLQNLDSISFKKKKESKQFRITWNMKFNVSGRQLKDLEKSKLVITSRYRNSS